MPITKPDLPVLVLDAIAAAGFEFVVLHNENRIGTPALGSDVDIAVERPVKELLRRISEPLDAAGLRVAVIWPYDLSGTASVFFATLDGQDGAQIDMLHDPQGRGRYGLRSDVILNCRLPGSRYPIPDAIDGALYSLMKANRKGQRGRVSQGLMDLSTRQLMPAAKARAFELFSPGVVREVVDLLEGRHPQRSIRLKRSLGSMVRILGRTVQPIGYWVEVVGPSADSPVIAESLRRRLGEWLLRAESGLRPRGQMAALVWWIARVQPVRLRAGVFISWSESADARPRADLVLRTNGDFDPDVLARQVVEGMAAKASR